jgi:hypothetical protein
MEIVDGLESLNSTYQLMSKFKTMLTREILGSPQDWEKEFELLGGEMPGLFHQFLLAKDVVRFKETRLMADRGETKALARADAIIRGVVFLTLDKCGWRG